MIINEIRLLDFGKFKDMSIKLDKGINVIFGHNEAGKSTIHRFIEGMFYGLSDTSKYKPWSGESFAGQIIYSTNEGKVSLTRDFKNKTVTAEDVGTEEDIRDFFSRNKKTGLIEPGKTIFGVNKRVFKNSFSINQLGSKTDDELLAEIKEKIENLAKSRDETIKMAEAFNGLKKMSDEIGNENDITSQLGFIRHKIEALMDEKKKRNDLNLRFNRKLVLVDVYNKQLNFRKEELSKINEIVDELENEKLSATYDKAVQLQKDIDALNAEIGNSKSILEITMEEYEKLIRTISRIEQLEELENDLKTQMAELKKEVDDIKSSYIVNFDSDEYKKLETSYEMYQNDKDVLDRLGSRIDTIKQEMAVYEKKNHGKILESFEKFSDNIREIRYLKGIMDSDIITVMTQKLKKEKRNKNIKLIVAFFLALAIVVGTYWSVIYYGANMFYAILASLIVPMLIVKNTTRSTNLIKSLKLEIHTANEKKVNSKELLSYLVEENNQLIINTDCSNFNELRSKYNISLSEIHNTEERKKTLETLKEEYNFVKRKFDDKEVGLLKILKPFGYENLSDDIIRDVTDKIQESNIKFDQLNSFEQNFENLENELEVTIRERENHFSLIEVILENNNVESIEELKHQISEQKDLQGKIVERKDKNLELTALLGGHSMEELREKIERSGKIFQELPYKDKNQVYNKRDDILEDIIALEEKYDKLINNLSDERDQARVLVEILEELEYYTHLKEQLIYNKQLIDEANRNISGLSAIIQEEFLPKLNRKINYYMNIITNGKYKEVLIGKDLHLSIFDEYNNMVVDIDNLSAGTIDQLFFAVRVALIDIISRDKSSPIILDDCFTQYDDERLLNALKILRDIGTNRQVLLFSCHRREGDMLRDMESEFNYVALS
ncbi:MAG: DNA double-strand break repair Rad50 ATPase [Clostridiales bacterium 38_11]|nr:MAG: DNA double-strand break repair Rad50 ATPase [Clostridiales bacterium 38_11]